MTTLKRGDFVRLGSLSGLRITRPRFSLLQRLEKRAFDLFVANRNKLGARDRAIGKTINMFWRNTAAAEQGKIQHSLYVSNSPRGITQCQRD